MKKKVLLSILMLLILSFSIFGFAGCDDRSKMVIVRGYAKRDGKRAEHHVRFRDGDFIDIQFNRIHGLDINGNGIVDVDGDDLNKDGVVDSTDLMQKKAKLISTEITAIYVGVTGIADTENGSELSWDSYEEFVANGGIVTGFNLDQKPGTYYMSFMYGGFASVPIGYEIVE